MEDRQLKVHIRVIHRQSRGTYGAPRVQQQLKNEGFEVGRRRVARLMREESLAGLPKKRFRKTTDSSHKLPVFDNLLSRDFNPSGPNKAWVTDITYVPTISGFLYLAVFIDLFSRKVVGWAAKTHMRTDLCLEALKQAATLRRPKPGLIIHSDRGSQYASREFRNTVSQPGFRSSMSRTGDCWDNAPAESFFGTLKIELLNRKSWTSPAEAKDAIADYIHRFYNSNRLHSNNGYLSPVDFEIAYKQQRAKLAA